ncbi:MAG: DUF2752 domain-containing protein [Aquihabitans sp.]
MASLAYEHLPPPPDQDRAADRARLVGSASLTMVGVGAVLLAGRAVSLHLPPCPFRAATGVPCPGCGMTRLADAVAHGRFGQALSGDVAGVAVLATLAVIASAYLVRVVIQKREAPRWMRHPALLFGFGALVLAHWATTIVTGGLPST